MSKIQNKNFPETEINFEKVGIVKSDKEGIFDIPDDEIAKSVVKAIKGFVSIKEEKIETKTETKKNKVDVTPIKIEDQLETKTTDKSTDDDKK